LLKENLRANESALKMPADGRKHEAVDLQLPGEWAFSLERLADSFCLRNQGMFHKTDSKGALWRAFAYFCLAAKVGARPGMRGRAAPAETPWRDSTRNVFLF